jgi:hypothetical protein
LSSFSACHPCIALQLKFSTIPTLKHGFLRLCLGGENTSPLLRFPLVQIQSVSPFTSFYSPCLSFLSHFPQLSLYLTKLSFSSSQLSISDFHSAT